MSEGRSDREQWAHNHNLAQSTSPIKAQGREYDSIFWSSDSCQLAPLQINDSKWMGETHCNLGCHILQKEAMIHRHDPPVHDGSILWHLAHAK